MNELYTYYKTRLIAWAIVIALAAFLLPAKVVPLIDGWIGKEHCGSILAGILASRPMIVLYLVVGEWFIRKRLWKIEKKEFDFDGLWKGVTTYSKVPIGYAEVPFTSEHQVRIEQNSVSLKIAPTEGNDYTNWGSLALQLVDKDTIIYAYWVKYGKSDKFPEQARGLEEMHVTERDNKGRPVKMTGTFAHCPEGQEPVYSGTVEFWRQ
jgi:hypothetical protein